MSRRLTVRIAVALVVSTLIGSGALAAEHLLLPPAGGDGVLTLLLLGSDEGPPRSANPLAARADGFQLLFVAEDRQHASFVSIPRDSWVTVTDRGNNRINACLNGGPDGCANTVEQEFGIEVDGYLLTSMRGFANAVQSFGGVTVDVPTPVYNGGSDIPTTGVQELSGSQALTYARDRKNRPGGDFDRTRAQAELLAIGHADVVRAGDASAVLDAVTVLRRHTETDLTARELVRLGFEAMHLPPENVQRERAPARIGTVGAASVVFLEDEAYALIRDAAEDGRIGAEGSD